MRKLLSEFKEFALKGNVINLAVGVMIGAAFQAVVASLTENILSPVIGLFANENFDALSVSFFGVTLKYGAFVSSVVNFFIMAFVVFLIVRAITKATSSGKAGKKAEAEAAAPAVVKCKYCQTEISALATRCPACTSSLERQASR